MNKEEILKDIKDRALKDNVPILQDTSMDLIETVLNLKRPNTILEVGTAVGYSAIMFSKYLSGENAKITTLELNEERYNIAKKNISKMELDGKIDVILCDATKYLKELDETYDIVFIDAAKGQYNIFLEEALRLTKPGSIIIADNVLWHGLVLSDYNEHRHRTAVTRLRTFLNTIKTDERLDTKVFNIGDGVAISFVK